MHMQMDSIPSRSRFYYDKLYGYEQNSVDFMLKKFSEGIEGILVGHAPGIGKTPISCVFCSCLFEQFNARLMLVTVPKAVVDQWRQHFLQWSIVPVFVYQGQKSRREQDFDKFIKGERGVIIITYETLLQDFEYIQTEILKVRASLHKETLQKQEQKPLGSPKFTSTGNRFLDMRMQMEYDLQKVEKIEVTPEKVVDFEDFPDVSFDICIFDEITEMKNEHSICSKRFSSLSTRFKVGLTGTPVMNDLKELYNIVQFVNPGFFGPMDEFMNLFAMSIARAQLRDVDDSTKAIGRLYQDNLISELQKMMIRYTKQQISAVEVVKHEILIWANTSPLQNECYEQIINSWYFKEQFSRLKSEREVPFELISVLRKTAEHCLKLTRGETHLLSAPLRRLIWQEELDNCYEPANVSEEEEMSRGHSILNDEVSSESEYSVEENENTLHQLTQLSDGNQNSIPSEKLEITLYLLKSFKERNLKVLLFTEHTTTLDLIEFQIAKELHIEPLRIDGKVFSTKGRSQIMANFTQSEKFEVLIMTMRACGMGLNLQAARRVIIFSPNWNPQIEEEAAARAYRLGQREDVYVYKIVMRNTIEEKLVARQFQKLQIANAATNDLNTKVKVSTEEILDLLRCRTIEQIDGRIQIKRYNDEIDDGIEETLTHKFPFNEFLTGIDEAEQEMISACQEEYEAQNIRFTLTVDDMCQEQLQVDEEIDASEEFTEKLQSTVVTLEQLREGYTRSKDVLTSEEGYSDRVLGTESQESNTRAEKGKDRHLTHLNAAQESPSEDDISGEDQRPVQSQTILDSGSTRSITQQDSSSTQVLSSQDQEVVYWDSDEQQNEASHSNRRTINNGNRAENSTGQPTVLAQIELEELAFERIPVRSKPRKAAEIVDLSDI